jgi:membrane-bound serine protease (ClpP class)
MPRTAVTRRGDGSVRARWRRPLGALLLLAGLAASVAPASHAQDTVNPVVVVQVRGEIDLGLAPYLARVLAEAEHEQARAVILEIDTPGGRLDAVLQMRHAIVGSPVRTIAFVDRNAFSAGALLAIAATELYMAPAAVVGAATPVLRGSGEAADEKTISAVRTTFKSTAELRGRDPRVAEAMVDPAVEVPGLVGRGQLLTLTASEAVTWGYAARVVADRAAVIDAAGLSGAVVRETSPALAEQLVRFLTSPVVAGLLIAAGFLLLLADLIAGGGGLGTVAGLALLGVFFWGHMLAGLAGWEGVALVLLGAVLLGLEAFVVPGFGLPGIAGFLATAAGLFLSLVGGEIVTTQDLVRAGSTLALGLAATLAGGALLLWLVPRTAGAGGLVLRARLAAPGVGSLPARGAEPAAARSLAQRPPVADAASLVGARGTAASDLRPGGVARIGGARVDVVTEGDYVPAGEQIVVVRDEGYRRVVRRLDAGDGEDPETSSRWASDEGASKGTGVSQ